MTKRERIRHCICGAKPEVTITTFVCLDKVAQVKCPKCFRRTKLHIIDHAALIVKNDEIIEDDSTRYTLAEARNKAIDEWNQEVRRESK